MKVIQLVMITEVGAMCIATLDKSGDNEKLHE